MSSKIINELSKKLKKYLQPGVEGLNDQTKSQMRSFYLSTDKTQAKIVLVILALTIMLFSISDFMFFSFSTIFYGLTLIRLILVFSSIYVIKKINKATNFVIYDKIVILYLFAIVIGILVVNITRPYNFLPHIIVIDLAVFVFYIAVPTKFLNQVAAATSFSIGELFILTMSFNILEIPALFTALLGLLFANIVASIISLQIFSYRWRIYQNIEELKIQTNKIREADQRYHDLYESFGEAFIAVDWNLNVIHWNKAAERVTATSAENALGKKISDVLPEMLTVDTSSYLEALQKNRQARFMMNAISRETKHEAIFEVSTYPSEQGIIIIVEDKTEEEKMKKLSAIGATAGMVGHDIRNPLQVIESELFLARQAIDEMPKDRVREGAVESINCIQDQINYINKIVSDLQDYARPLKAEYKEVDLASLIAETVQTIQFPNNIKFEIDIGIIGKIKADPTFLRRALTNLINNGIQAMTEGGKLEISAKRTGKSITISISDTGKGIPQELKSKLFTPLLTTKAKGQGLGLAVTKRLIEALNGTITFESQEGKGTKFHIKLPAS